MVCLFSPCVVVGPLQKNMQGANNVFFCLYILRFCFIYFTLYALPCSFDVLQLLKRRLTPLLSFSLEQPNRLSGCFIPFILAELSLLILYVFLNFKNLFIFFLLFLLFGGIH